MVADRIDEFFTVAHVLPMMAAPVEEVTVTVGRGEVSSSLQLGRQSTCHPIGETAHHKETTALVAHAATAFTMVLVVLTAAWTV